MLSDRLRERQVDWFLHFTRADNLKNIFRYGLLPRSSLERRGIEFTFNDEYRYDHADMPICVSIEFPNYKMFYSLRMDSTDQHWAVLLLDAHSIVKNNECVFCLSNAGSAEIFNTPIEQRTGDRAFDMLYSEIQGKPSREIMGLDPWLPTNPQAEVLLFQKVGIDCIQSVYFNNMNILRMYRDDIPDTIETKVNIRVFGPRKDWEHWKR